MTKVLIKLYIGLLRVVYAFLKIALPTDPKRITFLSRQGNTPSLDFTTLKAQLLERDPRVHIVMLTRRMKKGLWGKVRYFFHIFAQMAALAKSSVCVADSYIIPVSVLRHKKTLRVLQSWHAVGTVKKFGWQTVGKEGGRGAVVAKAMHMHEGYDAVLSGSEAMRPVFAEAFGVGEERVIVRRPPKFAYLSEGWSELRERILVAYPQLRGKRVVLYAPTFRRTAKEHPQSLSEQFLGGDTQLVVKVHPTLLTQYVGEHVLTCAGFSAFELLSVADALVTDYSAMAFEAAAFGVSVYFYAYDLKEYQSEVGLNIDLKSELPGTVFAHSAEVASAILAGDYDFDALRNFAKKYACNDAPDGGLSDFIVNWLHEGVHL